jgi:hypothetical protein
MWIALSVGALALVVLIVALVGAAIALALRSSEPSDKEVSAFPDVDVAGATTELPSRGARDPVHAVAPVGLDARNLGALVDENFGILPGTSAFPGAKQLRSDVNVMAGSMVHITSDVEISAHAKVWGVGGLGLSVEHGKHYLAQRAFQITHTLEIDDSNAPAQTPAAAGFYLWRIHYGRIYEMVAEGSSLDAKADLEADLVQVASTVGAGAGVSRSKDNVSVHGRGMKPKSGDWIHARTPQQIADTYTMSDQPVPIFVDYVALRPGATTSAPAAEQWKEYDVVVRFHEIRIYKDNSFFQAHWSLAAYCKLNGQRIASAEAAGGDTALNQLVSDKNAKCGDRKCGYYPLRWSMRLPKMRPGGKVACGVEGSIDKKPEKFTPNEFKPVTVQEGLSHKGSFGVDYGKAQYQIKYSVTVAD